MKTLTIKQPYATLIAEGVKKYEFRSWKTNYRGKFLIHAGKGIDKEAMVRVKDYGFKYPSGKIIAVVDLVDCIKVNKEFRNELNKVNPLVYKGVSDTDYECYAFKLDNVKKIDIPDVNGKLSFWDFDFDDK